MTKKQRDKKRTIFLVKQPNGRYAIYNMIDHHFIRSNIIMLEEAKRFITRVFGIINIEVSTILKEKKGGVEIDFWVVCMEDMKSNFRSCICKVNNSYRGYALYVETYKNHTRQGLIGGI